MLSTQDKIDEENVPIAEVALVQQTQYTRCFWFNLICSIISFLFYIIELFVMNDGCYSVPKPCDVGFNSTNSRYCFDIVHPTVYYKREYTQICPNFEAAFKRAIIGAFFFAIFTMLCVLEYLVRKS